MITHTAFKANDTVYYAARDEMGWDFQPVETAEETGSPYLALGSDGVPHLTYRWENIDFPPSRLRYAYSNAPNSWHTIFMTDVVDVNGTHIAVDSDNNPHILYQAGSSSSLPKHLYWDGLVWNSEEFRHYDSFVLDENDNFHISYPFNGSAYQAPGDIEYAQLENNSWQTETVDADGGFARPNLTLNSNLYPHIVYQDIGFHLDKSIKYAYLDANGWHTDTIESGVWLEEDSFYFSTIAMDRFNRPHVVYIYAPASGCNELRHAYIPPEQLFLPMTVKEE